MERECADLLALMEASYLQEDSHGAEAMRRLLFAAGAVVAAADGEVSAEELDSLSELLGPARVPRELDPALLRKHLPKRIERVKELVSRARRVQLVRDLTLIARADGHVSEAELAEIRSLAGELEVDARVVEVVVSSPVEID